MQEELPSWQSLFAQIRAWRKKALAELAAYDRRMKYEEEALF